MCKAVLSESLSSFFLNVVLLVVIAVKSVNVRSYVSVTSCFKYRDYSFKLTHVLKSPNERNGNIFVIYIDKIHLNIGSL